MSNQHVHICRGIGWIWGKGNLPSIKAFKISPPFPLQMGFTTVSNCSRFAHTSIKQSIKQLVFNILKLDGTQFYHVFKDFREHLQQKAYKTGYVSYHTAFHSVSGTSSTLTTKASLFGRTYWKKNYFNDCYLIFANKKSLVINIFYYIIYLLLICNSNYATF